MTHLRRIFLTGICAATALSFMVQGAWAQSKAPVTAVIDMRVVQRDSIAGKAWQDYYNAKRKTFKDQIGVEEKAVRSAWDELSRQRSILAPQAFQARERAFREMEAAASGRIRVLEQQLTREMRATQAELGKEMDSALAPILEKIIKAKGIDIIVKKDDLIFVRKEFDLTPEVLKQLDKALPNLDISALAAKAKK